MYDAQFKIFKTENHLKIALMNAAELVSGITMFEGNFKNKYKNLNFLV